MESEELVLQNHQLVFIKSKTDVTYCSWCSNPPGRRFYEIGLTSDLSHLTSDLAS